jgi:hypothetical protein
MPNEPEKLKSAHDCLELFDIKKLTSYDKWIAAIDTVRLNSYKAGMRKAARHCEDIDGNSCNTGLASQYDCSYSLKTLAETITEKEMI